MSDLPIPFDRNRRLEPEDDPDALPEGSTGELIVFSDEPGGEDAARRDPDSGALVIDSQDGGSVVVFNPAARRPAESEDDKKHFANLAARLSDYERGHIVQEVIDGVEADDRSRQDWLETLADGIKMLGTKVEKPASGSAVADGPVEGMSTIRHPLLLEAIVRFQANAAAELYPPSGPVKVRDDRTAKPAGVIDIPNVGIGHNGGPSLDPVDKANRFAADQATREELAEALEKGFNHNLTVTDRGYRPDSVRMLFRVGFVGCGFKKVYDCPIKQRPVSRFVDAADVIVSNAVSDHRDAGRITHRIVMRPALVRRMQIAGVYRDTSLGQAQYQPNVADEAIASAQGLDAMPQRQEDQPRTLYESYVEIDIPGYEHKDKGLSTGIPLPWKVTIDKDSRELLELRRNWEEDDETYSARQVFVKFSFIPAMGFYDLGLLHMLGNGDQALTAAWREALDCGMFGNFPGFMYNEGAIRNWTNDMRVGPGGGLPVKGIGNLPLDQVIKPLPYKDVSPGFVALTQHIEQRMDRVAGTGEAPVGEGRQDAPVGTTLALIEQATKVLAMVHIGLHDSQAQEFELLAARYRNNPESFWKGNKRAPAWETEMFLRALDDMDLVPAADPNTPSHMMRLIKCQAVKTVAMMSPEKYDMKKVDAWIFKMIGVSDPDQFFAPDPEPGSGGMDPSTMLVMMQAQLKMKEIEAKSASDQMKAKLDAVKTLAEHQMRLQELEQEMAIKNAGHAQDAKEAALSSADRAADRHSEEQRQIFKLYAELVKMGIEGLGQQAGAEPAPPQSGSGF